MFNCKSVSEKVSLAMDQTLPFRERLMIMLHMWMCKYCRRFKKQLLILSKAAQFAELSSGDADQTLSLSLEAKERIKKNVAAAVTDPIQ